MKGKVDNMKTKNPRKPTIPYVRKMKSKQDILKQMRTKYKKEVNE